MNRRTVALVVGLSFAVVLGVVGSIAALVLGIFKLIDGTDAHVCGLAYVRSSPAAARLTGTPISQKGFTGGSSSSDNGELRERITFTVSGPLGDAFAVSEGFRSPIESHLTVRVGRDQESSTVYDGRFDCPELHPPVKT